MTMPWYLSAYIRAKAMFVTSHKVSLITIRRCRSMQPSGIRYYMLIQGTLLPGPPLDQPLAIPFFLVPPSPDGANH